MHLCDAPINEIDSTVVAKNSFVRRFSRVYRFTNKNEIKGSAYPRARAAGQVR